MTDRIKESRFDALMNAAVDAIIIIDHLGIIQQFNPAAEAMFGYDEAEVLGKNVRVLSPEPHRSNHDEYLLRYRETGNAAIIGRGREETGVRKDGSSFPMHLSVGEIQTEDSLHFVGIIKDLTEYRAAQVQVRQLEEQLLHADRLVILGELTAGIAHEINQPLTAIAAYADAGRKMLESRERRSAAELQSVCERIAEQSRRAGEVVQRLRKLVRSGSVSKSSHDINQVVKQVLLLFEYEVKKHSIDLQFLPSEDEAVLHLDEIQIQQILVNLVKNSLDALTEDGRTDGKITLSVTASDDSVAVRVSDNGPGVPDEQRGHLFEPFFTTKPKGVGLGLSICKNIAGAHGGNLAYQPGDEGGSVFVLTLPHEMIG